MAIIRMTFYPNFFDPTCQTPDVSFARKGQFHEMLYRHRANYFRWYNISWNWPFRKKHTSGVWQVGSKKFGWNIILIIAIRKIVNSREWHFGLFRDFITSRFWHLGGLTSSELTESSVSDEWVPQKTQTQIQTNQGNTKPEIRAPGAVF